MLSGNNRRLPQLHARLARRDERCSEYSDHKTRKQYRIFADHGRRLARVIDLVSSVIPELPSICRADGRLPISNFL